MANQGKQGTGRHPHKDSQEPWPHTQGNRQQNQQGGGGRQQGGGSGGGSGGGRQQQQQQQQGRSGDNESQDLKAREYRDENGQIHHHTRTYMDQHGKDGGRSR